MCSLFVLQMEDRYDSLFQLFMEENKAICKANGMEYKRMTKSNSRVPPYWGKVFELYEWMQCTPGDTNYFMWLDSDAVFLHFDFEKLQALLQTNASYSMIVSNDMPPWTHVPFNAGCFIVKNNAMGKEIMQRWISCYDESKWVLSKEGKWSTHSKWAGLYYEQGSFIHHILKSSYFGSHILHLPYYVLNNNSAVEYKDDCFICHLAGLYKRDQDLIQSVLSLLKYNLPLGNHNNINNKINNNPYATLSFYAIAVIITMVLCALFIVFGIGDLFHVNDIWILLMVCLMLSVGWIFKYYTSGTIPKVVFQTSKGPPDPSAVQQIQNLSKGWTYLHFEDDDILHYFDSHPLPEFPNIKAVFHSFARGAHRADLFRYYFLYINGGVFIDSDAMIQTDLNNIVRSYSFFSVTSKINPNTIFQGFIGAAPKHGIVYRALQDAYHVQADQLNRDYQLLIRNLYGIVFTSPEYWVSWVKGGGGAGSVMLYEEDNDNDAVAKTYNKYADGEIILLHYWKSKKIPATISKATIHSELVH